MYLCCSYAFAGFVSEEEAIDRIDTLYQRSTDSPAKVLDELEPLLVDIQEKKWKDALLSALMLKANLYLDLNDKNKAKLIVQEIVNENLSPSSLEQSLEYDLLNLDVQIGEATHEKLQDLHATIFDKIQQVDDKALVMRAYAILGYSFTLLDVFDEAIFYLNRSHSIANELDDDFEAANALNSLANIYTELGEYQSAIEHYKQTYAIVSKNKNRYGMAILEYNIGSTYQRDDQFIEAEQFLLLAIESGKASEFDAIVVYSQQRIAELKARKDEWQTTLDLYRKVEAFHEKAQNSVFLFEAYIGIARSYIGLGDFDSAQMYMDKTRQLLQKIDLPKRQLSYVDLTYQFHYAKGEYQLAADLLQQAVKLQEEIYKEERRQNIEKNKVFYDTERVRIQNETLLKNKELNEQIITEKINRERAITVAAVLATGLIALLLLILILQIRNREKFEQLALVDFLTQSPNRRAIIEQARRYFEKQKSLESSSLLIGLVDFDDFKKLNDKYGHEIGDKVLQAFSKACKNKLRDKDSFGRYGGEEWLFLFVDADESKIEYVFDRIRDDMKVALLPFFTPDQNITFSVGLAKYDHNADRSINDLIARADKNLYKAKALGKNTIVIED